jgi:oligopeptide/dipeptide ABC transporter ATP-binding protein
MSNSILEVKDLNVRFKTDDGVVNAVRGVNFKLGAHEVLGIVGESGSGKSVTGLSIMGLLAKNATVSGDVTFHDQSISAHSEKQMMSIRGRSIAMIFQDPLTSLNPVYKVGWQLSEALMAHQKDLSKDDAKKAAIGLLEMVGIPQADQRIENYPHEFSGGMRQRVVIAMAMANNPEVVLADEPTTALDVTVQAQVLDALGKVLRATQASLVLVTHDLGVIAGLADRVAVMYAGRIVELGTADDIFYHPAMPYTHGLLGSVPRVDNEGGERLRQIPGSPPSLLGERVGCPFAPRCPLRQQICREQEPDLKPVSVSVSPGPSADGSEPEPHLVACHFAEDAVKMPIGSMFSDKDTPEEEVE